MRYYYSKKIAGSTLAVILAATLTQPLVAEELDTEIPSAGAAVVIEDYIANSGSTEDLSAFLPKEEQTTAATATNKAPAEASKEDTYFKDIAITKVNGGKEDYVNVRKKPSTDAKVVGKIYNNCGAEILEKTDNGWYKVVSGNCTGYIKAEYFATGTDAKSEALDNGYVFAKIKGTGVHVREQASTDSKVVTNVYKNENYSIKKFSKDGKWVKLKIELKNGDRVTGWVSSEFVKVSVNMDTALTIKEEKAIIKKQEEAARQAALEEQRRQEEENANADNDTDTDTNTDTDLGASSANISSPTVSNNSSSNSNSNSNSSSSSSSRSSSSSSSSSSNSSSSSSSTGGSSSSSSSGGGSAVVAYAKQFLGNPYVYGGSSLTNGTDCSGFTMSVYAHFGYGLNRASYTQVYNGRSVSMSELQPGDLLFYKYGGSTISHVAIYIGGGQIIHASTEKTGIIIGGMGSPCAARRIIN